jgi:hypothetical protein
MKRKKIERLAQSVWLVQAGYYLVSGIWPLVEIRSFQALTGPKTDRWLVKTVGLLVTVIGAGLAMAGARRRITPEVATIAIGCGVGLSAIDVVYVSRSRISPVYLLDVVAHAFILGGWLIALRRPGFLTH